MFHDRVFDNFLFLKERDLGFGEDSRLTLRKAMRNRRAKRVCCDEAHAKYQQDVDSGIALNENGSIQTFFEWLLENADAIFALIARILALFGL